MRLIAFATIALLTVPTYGADRYIFEDFGFSVTPPVDWNIQHNTRVAEQYRTIYQKYGHDTNALAKQALVLMRVLPKAFEGDKRHQPTLACVGLFQGADPATALVSSRNIFIGPDTGDTVSEILQLQQGELDISHFSVVNKKSDQNLAFYSFRANDKLAVCSASFSEAYRTAAEQFLGSISKHKS